MNESNIPQNTPLTPEQFQQVQQAQQAQQSNNGGSVGGDVVADVGIGLADSGVGAMFQGKAGVEAADPSPGVEAFNTGGGIEGVGFGTGEAMTATETLSGSSIDAAEVASDMGGMEVGEWIGSLLEGGGEVIGSVAESAGEVAADVIGGIVSGLLSG